MNSNNKYLSSLLISGVLFAIIITVFELMFNPLRVHSPFMIIFRAAFYSVVPTLICYSLASSKKIDFFNMYYPVGVLALLYYIIDFVYGYSTSYLVWSVAAIFNWLVPLMVAFCCVFAVFHFVYKYIR